MNQCRRGSGAEESTDKKLRAVAEPLAKKSSGDDGASTSDRSNRDDNNGHISDGQGDQYVLDFDSMDGYIIGNDESDTATPGEATASHAPRTYAYATLLSL